MKRTTLISLIKARRDKRPVVVLRWMKTGKEELLDLETPNDGRTQAVSAAVADAFRQDKGLTVETADGPLFIQPFNPPLRLIVIGAVHIAQSLVPMAVLAGYDVVVVDPRRAFASDRRFPGVTVSEEWPDDAIDLLKPDQRTAVVTLTHDPKLDDPALDRTLRTEAFYIASLGSRKTHGARLERLGELGHDETSLQRIHGPAGLDIRAVSPAEIAVSVLAEMTQVLRQASAA